MDAAQASEGAEGAIGSALDEAHALAGLGRCAADAGRTAQAEALLRQAHEIFQRTGAAEAPAVLAELQCPRRPRLTTAQEMPSPTKADYGPGLALLRALLQWS